MRRGGGEHGSRQCSVGGDRYDLELGRQAGGADWICSVSSRAWSAVMSGDTWWLYMGSSGPIT